MRRVLYRVASSLDGYIEGPRGEIDWIVQDPTMNLATLYAGIDTALLGRRTYELTQRPGGTPFLGAGAVQTRLKLTHSETHPSGIVRLHYDIRHD
jgi:dihydrofolate reductase